MENLVIYQIQNLINGKVYIGSTINFEKRKEVHFRTLENNKHHSVKLQRAFNYYGIQNFSIEIIDYVDNIKNLLKIEQWYMNSYDCVKNGYNINPTAGSNFGFRFTEQQKNKLSQSLKTAWLNPTLLKKASDSQNKRWLQPGARENHRKDYIKEKHSFFGKHQSDEAKRKISESRKGHIPWNKSATPGVSFCKRDNNWLANYWENGKTIYVGRFIEKQDAVDAVFKAKQK